MGRTLSRPEVPPSFLRAATPSITDPSDVDWKKLLWVRGPPGRDLGGVKGAKWGWGGGD